MISRGQIYFVNLNPRTGAPNLAGSLPPARMIEVERALKLVLDFPPTS